MALYLKKHHPGLLPAHAGRADTLRQAHVPMDFKRDILETVRHECGSKALLSIGQGINSITYDPIWQGALLSQNPWVLFDKWRRFEVFAHSKNRVKIRQFSKTQASFKRYSVDGNIPTAAENLLICGLIIGLLEGIGCRDLWCEMAVEGGRVLRIRNKRKFFLPERSANLATEGWTIGWKTQVSPGNVGATNDQLPQIDMPPVDDKALADLIKAATDLLLRDVARQWNLKELAREIGLSTRTFQRRLGEADLSFSQLVRLVRIHEACRLLKHDNTPLTVVGFCAGFSDSAHFSRDFRASMGLTPSEFRTVL